MNDTKEKKYIEDISESESESSDSSSASATTDEDFLFHISFLENE